MPEKEHIGTENQNQKINLTSWTKAQHLLPKSGKSAMAPTPTVRREISCQKCHNTTGRITFCLTQVGQGYFTG